MKTNNSFDIFYLSRTEFLGLAIIIAFALFLLTALMPCLSFQSDESVYVYASYAIQRGVVPYKEIHLAHPPLAYLIYASLIRIIGPNIYDLRLSVVGINLAAVILTYFIVKGILINQENNKKLGLICAGVYAFYPLCIITGCIIEPILNLLILMSVLVYVLYIVNGSRSKLLLSLTGVFVGLACITKLSAIFFAIALLAYHLAMSRWKRKKMSDTVFILIGMAIPVSITFFWVNNYSNAFRQFYLQVGYWQLIHRFPTFAEKWSAFTEYVFAFLPLIPTGAIGGVFLIMKAKSDKNPLILLPLWIYVSNLVLLVFTTNSYFHYFYYLSPYLVFLSVTCFYQLPRFLRRTRSKLNQKYHLVALFTSLVFMFITIMFIVSSTLRYLPSVNVFSENVYTNVEFYVGKYVKSITNQSDKIWTSEGAIAFFAERLIVKPDSSDWPLQAFFSDVFAHAWNKYIGDGMKDYKEGIVFPKQFIEAWENENVTVIVIIRGQGWIPYPDELLWNGYRGQEGAGNYVQEHYELRRIIRSPWISYSYEVWVKR